MTSSTKKTRQQNMEKRANGKTIRCSMASDCGALFKTQAKNHNCVPKNKN
ncbi:hypothetical protein LINGRAHAP2_LOCUS35261 [Linum grandiflorum]